MRLEVRGAVLCGRPIWAKLQHLTPQLVCNPQGLAWAARAGDLGPVGVLGVVDSDPVAVEEGAQVSGDQWCIVASDRLWAGAHRLEMAATQFLQLCIAISGPRIGLFTFATERCSAPRHMLGPLCYC